VAVLLLELGHGRGLHGVALLVLRVRARRRLGEALLPLGGRDGSLVERTGARRLRLYSIHM
jgi:hypothetical protein